MEIGELQKVKIKLSSHSKNSKEKSYIDIRTTLKM